MAGGARQGASEVAKRRISHRPLSMLKRQGESGVQTESSAATAMVTGIFDMQILSSKHTFPALLASALLTLTACQAPVTQEQSGMVIGGLVGGALGSQFGQGSGRTAAVILGTLAGVAVGGAVGRSMAERDRYMTAQTLETVRTGVPSQWVNPDTGHRYTVVPTRTYGSQEGPCREYQINAVIGGRTEQMWGTACRQPDGSWRAQP